MASMVNQARQTGAGDDVWLTARQMRARYQMSPATEWRYRQNPALGFPKPMKVGSRKLYRLADLIEWEQKMMERADA